MPRFECAADRPGAQGITGGRTHSGLTCVGPVPLQNRLTHNRIPPPPKTRWLPISFRNYYPDTARLFPELVARQVPAISITDSLLSPIVEGATVVFEIQDMPEPALRPLVAPMCLVQALAIGLDLAAD